MDYIGATPQSNPIMGLLAERLKQAQQFATRPFGYQNPPAEMLLNLLGVPAVQQTAERLAYGEPLTTGRGMTTQIRPEVAEAALTVAPVAGLLGRGAEKAAMAAGRAGERYAERVVPQIMEKGGMPAQLLQDLSQGSIRPMDVWHGSPHRFDRFDASKIGTGEGGSMYGVGTNLTESPSLAQNYRELTSGYEAFTTVDGLKDTSDMASMIARSYSGDAEKAVKSLESKIPNLEKKLKSASKEELMPGLSDYDMADMELQAQLRKVEEAKSYIGKDVKLEKPGYLYKVDLPDEIIAKMVDRDKPFSEQPKNVQDYFSKILKVDFENETGWAKLKGDRLIEAVRDRLNLGKGDFETALSEAGIPGSKYINESSGAGQGAQNFVVFPTNENLLTIKQINDKPVGGLLGQSKAAEATDLLSYRGSHSAPNVNVYGATLDDLTKIMPADVYESRGKQLYGIGNPMIDSQWRIAALKARGKPDADIEIYRAVPKGVDSINSGDWVTTSQEYAKWHGENVLNGDFDIIKKKVKAKTLSTEGYPYEFGYNQE